MACVNILIINYGQWQSLISARTEWDLTNPCHQLDQYNKNDDQQEHLPIAKPAF